MVRQVLSGRAFDGKSLVEDAVLEIDSESGLITGFGERGSVETAPDAKLRRLEGETMLPGLIDAHVHFYSATGSGVMEWAMVPDTLAVLRGARDLKRLLRSGFTSVRDLGSKGGVHLAKAVDEGSIEGPTVVSCSKALAQTGGDDDPPAFDLEVAQKLASYTYFCDGPWECRRAVRRVARDGGRVVKLYASGAFSRGGKIKPNFTLEEISAIVDESHRAGLKVAAHAYGEEALSSVVSAGVDSIEHGLGMTEEIAKSVAAKGIYYVPTLVTYLALPSSNRFREQLVRGHFEKDMPLVQERGVRVAMGSDIVGDGSRPHGRNFAEIVEEAKFLGNEEALAAATSRAAACIDLQDRGTLKEGFVADVVVVKGSPVADLRALAPENITAVFKGGSPVHLRP